MKGKLFQLFIIAYIIYFCVVAIAHAGKNQSKFASDDEDNCCCLSFCRRKQNIVPPVLPTPPVPADNPQEAPQNVVPPVLLTPLVPADNPQGAPQNIVLPIHHTPPVPADNPQEAPQNVVPPVLPTPLVPADNPQGAPQNIVLPIHHTPPVPAGDPQEAPQNVVPIRLVHVDDPSNIPHNPSAQVPVSFDGPNTVPYSTSSSSKSPDNSENKQRKSSSPLLNTSETSSSSSHNTRDYGKELKTTELLDLQHRADCKEPEACYELGRYIYQEEDRNQGGDIERFNQAIKYLTTAKDAGHSKAASYLQEITTNRQSFSDQEKGEASSSSLIQLTPSSIPSSPLSSDFFMDDELFSEEGIRRNNLPHYDSKRGLYYFNGTPNSMRRNMSLADNHPHFNEPQKTMIAYRVHTQSEVSLSPLEFDLTLPKFAKSRIQAWLVGKEEHESFPWNVHGCLMVHDSSGKEPRDYIASGMLIGSRYVLTAAHNFLNFDNRDEAKEDANKSPSSNSMPVYSIADRMTFYPFMHGPYESSGIPVNAVAMYAAYWEAYLSDGEISSQDIAILRLEKPVTEVNNFYTYNKYSEDNIKDIKNVCITGYPGRPPYCGRHMHKMETTISFIKDGVLYYKERTIKGLSGGSIWYKEAKFKSLLAHKEEITSTSQTSSSLSEKPHNFSNQIKTSELNDLRQRADRNEPEACYELGRYICETECSKDNKEAESYKQALDYLKAAANKGHTDAAEYIRNIEKIYNYYYLGVHTHGDEVSAARGVFVSEEVAKDLNDWMTFLDSF